jgi:hypothetical protein
MNTFFDRKEHVYTSTVFEEIIKDTIRFFNGTPVLELPPFVRFSGAGVYAIYYVGRSEYYKIFALENRVEFRLPIYVGKAVPRGWRQGRIHTASSELFRRLNEHGNSIIQTNNLDIHDFYCRFMILENGAEDMIGTVEAAMIRHYRPIWNTSIDGFGNHDPGGGRYEQAKSDWDILHPGRLWAEKCLGISTSREQIEKKATEYFTKQSSI